MREFEYLVRDTYNSLVIKDVTLEHAILLVKYLLEQNTADKNVAYTIERTEKDYE